VARKKRPELCVTITARILYGGEISFGTFVDQYVLLLTYKFQWRHCDRVYAKGRKSDICPNRLYHHRNRFSKKLMVSAGVLWNGKTEFFSSALKRLQSTIRLILTFWWRPCCHNAAVCIQTMISSPSHHDKANQNFLPDNTPDFISSQEWTPHSPDLNPLDYSVWDILQELVYKGRREPCVNLRSLQNVIRDKWHDVDDQRVRKAILQWKRRLAAVAKQNEGPIQHIFCWSVDWYELLWRSSVACVQPTT